MVVATSIIAGASGGALANVALSPLGGGAGMLQSYWYGAGLILGERMMYTFHWEKINTRIKKGEDFLSVLESEMNPAITAIANYSLTIMKRTGSIYLQGGIDFMAQLIENMFKLVAGESPSSIFPPPEPVPTPTEPPLVQCPPGFRWSASAQQCVPESIPEPGPVPQDPLIPSTKVLQNFADLPDALQANIAGQMNNISALNSLMLRIDKDINRNPSTDATWLRYRDAAYASIDRWKKQYLSVGGYKNPTPDETLLWVRPIFRSRITGWASLL